MADRRKKAKDSSSTTAEQLDVNLQIDDETLEELSELEGANIVKIVIWDESIIEALDATVQDLPTVDVDVYLEDGVLFELYGVLCYPDLESDPLGEPAAQLDAAVGNDAQLAEIAVDPEDDLVLVLYTNDGTLYLNVGAWSLEEWEELPE